MGDRKFVVVYAIMHAETYQNKLRLYRVIAKIRW